jgi:hypothetical protein
MRMRRLRFTMSTTEIKPNEVKPKSYVSKFREILRVPIKEQKLHRSLRVIIKSRNKQLKRFNLPHQKLPQINKELKKVLHIWREKISQLEIRASLSLRLLTSTQASQLGPRVSQKLKRLGIVSIQTVSENILNLQ